MFEFSVISSSEIVRKNAKHPRIVVVINHSFSDNRSVTQDRFSNATRIVIALEFLVTNYNTMVTWVEASEMITYACPTPCNICTSVSCSLAIIFSIVLPNNYSCTIYNIKFKVECESFDHIIMHIRTFNCIQCTAYTARSSGSQPVVRVTIMYTRQVHSWNEKEISLRKKIDLLLIEPSSETRLR